MHLNQQRQRFSIHTLSDSPLNPYSKAKAMPYLEKSRSTCLGKRALTETGRSSKLEGNRQNRFWTSKETAQSLKANRQTLQHSVPNEVSSKLSRRRFPLHARSCHRLSISMRLFLSLSVTAPSRLPSFLRSRSCVHSRSPPSKPLAIPKWNRLCKIQRQPRIEFNGPQPTVKFRIPSVLILEKPL